MSIDPKKGGKCWSCKYCEDIGTHQYEDYVTYMRKCNKSGHDYVDKCQYYCSDYVWDGHTEVPGGSTSSSSSSSSSSSNLEALEDTNKGCFVFIIIGLIIAVIAFFVTNGFFGTKSAENAPAKETAAYEAVYEESLNISAKVDTNSKSLNLRAGPSKNYDVVGTLPKGATVVIHKKEGKWAYVEYKGKCGWCSTSYLKEKNNKKPGCNCIPAFLLFQLQIKVRGRICAAQLLQLGQDAGKMLGMVVETNGFLILPAFSKHQSIGIFLVCVQAVADIALLFPGCFDQFTCQGDELFHIFGGNRHLCHDLNMTGIFHNHAPYSEKSIPSW